MVKILWTEESVQWLHDIHDYIAKENVKAAKDVVTGIYAKVQVLSNFPELGYQYKQTDFGNIRILVFGHYKIAYLIKSESLIEILGVFHGALDMDKYLF